MLHKYRKTAIIQAEQFDGSREMADEYGLQKFGWKGFIKVPNSKNDFALGAPLIISEGDWFVKNDKGEIDVLSDNIFKKTYERCD